MNAGNRQGQESASVEQPSAGWVALVGAGPGDEGLLTVRATELLGQAGLVVAPADLTGITRRHVRADARLTEPADAATTAKTLVQAAQDGQLAVRLFGGDPLLNGAAAAVAERSLLEALAAGCSAPVGGYAAGTGQLAMRAAVLSLDGTRALRAHGSAPAADARRLGHDLAAELLRRGAADFISSPSSGNDVQ